MIKDLIKLANNLDKKGFHEEADLVDEVIGKIAKNLDGDIKVGHLHGQYNDQLTGWAVGVAGDNSYSKKELRLLQKRKFDGFEESTIMLVTDPSNISKMIASTLRNLGIESAPKLTRLFFYWDQGNLINQSGTGLDEYANKIMPNIERALSRNFSKEKIKIDMLKMRDRNQSK